jgi:hypothetical protein
VLPVASPSVAPSRYFFFFFFFLSAKRVVDNEMELGHFCAILNTVHVPYKLYNISAIQLYI